MTHLPAKPSLPDSKPMTLESFFEHMRVRNPFLANRVDRPLTDPLIDVFGIHEPEYRQILNLGRQAHQDNRGIGVVVWGEAGVGKSHLLARLGNWAKERQQACFVYLHNLQSQPERVPRTFMQSVLGGLTNGRMPPYHKTPLFALINSALREAMMAKGLVKGNWEQVGEAFHELIQTISARDHSRGVLFNRTIYEVLFRFYQGAYPAQQSKGDELADLALRWLYGDPLTAQELIKLDLRVEDDDAESGTLINNQRFKQVLVALTQLARMARQLFLICFDQVDNLAEAQIQSFSRFLHDLLDSAGNLMVVTTGVRETLIGFLQRGIITETSWDRIGQVEITLNRIPKHRAKDLLLARLQKFMEGARGLPELEPLIRKDNLFPLGTPWLEDRLQKLADLRPRDLLTWASRCWQQHQEVLMTTPGTLWLARWQQKLEAFDPNHNMEAETRHKEWDETVTNVFEEKMDTLRNDPDSLPVNEDTLRHRVYQLLQHCLNARLSSSFLNIEWVSSKGGARSTYDLIVRHRSEPDGQVVCFGLCFLVNNNSLTVAHSLRRLLEEANPPDRVFLITDQRQQLILGPEGKKRLDTLKRKGASKFKLIELSPEENAQMEALLVTLDMGESGLLPNISGETSAFTPRQILESHQRQSRLKNHRLLHMVLQLTTTGASDPNSCRIASTFTDRQIRDFIAAQVSLSGELPLPELAQRFLEHHGNDRAENGNLTHLLSRFRTISELMEKEGLLISEEGQPSYSFKEN